MEKQLIHIAEPCGVELSGMKACAVGFYCSSCKKEVLDLSRKKPEEIHRVLESSPGACIMISKKHSTARFSWKWVEPAAAWMKKKKLVRMAAMLVAACLFFSSCRKRVLMGAYAKTDRDGKQTETLQ